MTRHRQKDGQYIDIAKMADNHLLNTIRMMRMVADKGFIARSGGGHDADEMWCEEDHLQDEEALDYMGFANYIKELSKRGLEEKDDDQT